MIDDNDIQRFVESLTIHEDELQALAIFPLPQVVFHPHMLLPLHMFEPRYRKMTADLLASGKPLALVSLKPESSDRAESVDEPIRPAVFPVGGITRLVNHRLLPDGRYLVMLYCLRRIRILEELETGEPYRMVNAELVADEYPEGSAATLAERVNVLQTLTREVIRSGHTLAPALTLLLKHAPHPSMLADVMGALFVQDPRTCQTLLETATVVDRIEVVNSALAEVLAQKLTRLEPRDLN